jgi:superfamily II DNA helicase RecQ
MDQIRRIKDMSLMRLPEVIESARARDNVRLQEDLVQACLCRILSHESPEPREPRPEQVRTLRRLIFGKSDVLLIARTGFGKSLIFHAFSILTGKITLQLIPLSKLGDEQLCDIRRFPGARPCLINAKTRTEERDMLCKVAAGQYTHVLLGPEQASSRSFRSVLKKTDLQARIGLVAIDECHLIMQWDKFRPAFTLLGELRTILHKDIVWFGCSATLDTASEARVLNTAGFRRVGNRMYHTEIIRTSVDRPDVTLCVIPIPRGKLTSWDPLYFLLQSAVSDGRATPSNTPKTIVFIDGRRSVHAAAAWAMDELVRLSAEYSPDPVAGDTCIFNVVRTYTAHVSDYDRDLAYREFLGSSSKTRFMFATTSLGMGINIPDVARVVTWSIPITKSLGDIWQRIGRGGRGAGRTSQSYIMLPYWLFDTEGKCRPNACPPTPQASPMPLQRVRKGMRNQLPVAMHHHAW